MESEYIITPEAAATHYSFSSDSDKWRIHALREAACATIATALETTDIGELPDPNTEVDESVLVLLSQRVPKSLEVVASIGRELVNNQDENSQFEKFLNEAIILIPSEKREQLIDTIRLNTIKFIQEQRISTKQIVPAYLRLLHEKFTLDSMRNPKMQEMKELAESSLELVKRLAHGSVPDMESELDVVIKNDIPLRLDPNAYILLNTKNGKRVTLSEVKVRKVIERRKFYDTNILKTGCPALPNLIPVIVKKAVSK